MNDFSFSRFCKYAKAELCSNRKFLLLLAGSAATYFLIVHYFGYLANKDSGTMQFTVTIIFSWLAISIFSIVLISKAFSKYYNKGYATSTIMMPVAQSEKFLYVMAFYYIIAPVTLIGIAYIINLMWSMGCSIDNQFLLLHFDIIDARVISVFITQLSIFLFGAIFFRRNQFFLTALSSIFITLVIGYLIYILVVTGVLPSLQQWALEQMKNYSDDEIHTINILTTTCISVMATIVLISTTWRLFRKVQITK